MQGLSDGVPGNERRALEDWIVLLIFMLLALDVATQFFSRYVLESSLAWTEEAARYLLIMTTFLGAPLAVRRHSHICLLVVRDRLTPRSSKMMAMLVEFVAVGFCLILAFYSWEVSQRTVGTMISLPLPKSWLYYMVMIGLVLMALRQSIEAFRPQEYVLSQPTEQQYDHL